MHDLSFRRKKHVTALLDQLSSELPEAVQPKGVFTSQSFIGRHMPLSSSIVVGICPVTDAWINIPAEEWIDVPRDGSIGATADGCIEACGDLE